jgi:ankyrin repeat protein
MLARIANGRTDLVFPYLAAGGKATDSTDDVPLIRWCAYYGDVSAIRHLLAHGAELNTLGDNFEFSAACYHGHWRLAQFLFESGADLNHQDDTGETPLHAALSKANRWKYTPLVKWLLASGADPHRVTIPGRETGAFMRDCRTKGETPLHRAAAFGNEEDIEALLAAGAEIDAKDANGDTPLSWASWYLRPGSVLGLLLHGPYRIHPERRARRTCDPADGSMERDLLGDPLAE